MTTQRKNAISDLHTKQVAAIISHAYTINPKLHLISNRAFRHILGEIGHRDRPIRDKDRKEIGHWCGDTIEQLADATDWSCGTVSDVTQLATTVGVLRRVRRGGCKTATKRTIDLDAMWHLLNQLSADNPLLVDVAWRGYWRDNRGIMPSLRGADSATPIGIQDINQPPAAEVCSDCFGHGHIEVGYRLSKPCPKCHT